jgi:hypothetical protein
LSKSATYAWRACSAGSISAAADEEMFGAGGVCNPAGVAAYWGTMGAGATPGEAAFDVGVGFFIKSSTDIDVHYEYKPYQSQEK